MAVALLDVGSEGRSGDQERESVEITVRKIMGRDRDAIENAGKSGQQVFVPYLRHLLETHTSAPSPQQHLAEVALAKLGQVKELQEFWCLAITDDPKRGIWPSTFGLEQVGGWYAIQGLQKFLKPNGLIRWHKTTRQERNSDALQVPIEFYAVSSLARVIENRPLPMGSETLLAETHIPDEIALWQERIAKQKDELSKREPTGEGVNFSPQACKDGRPIIEGTLPFHLVLSEGYHPKSTAWNETRTGEISKDGGLSIRYDMVGDLKGKRQALTPVEHWKRECVWKTSGYPKAGSDTADMICWIDADGDRLYPGTLHVSFTDLTEFWTRVKSQQQANEALKMLLTYDPRVSSP